jgi:excinuclease ABC subunit C
VSRVRSKRTVPLPLPSTDLDQLLHRVRALAENRPAVYRMCDASGRVVYVGKAKKLRTRLLTYFRASYPDDKAARILYAASEIHWEYVPSEFAAYLGELRQIRKLRPYFNHKANRTRRSALIKVSAGPAPRVYGGAAVGREDIRCYGPFHSMSRMLEAVRTLNDLLGLRDCPTTMPVVFADQGDLFSEPRQAACMRYELGFCSGPCAGLVSQNEYQRRVDTAMAFLDGRTIEPLDRVIAAMQKASASAEFEVAARWRDKFEQLEWLLAATSRARTAIDLLTFVYRDPGDFGDDRIYLLKRGVVRASFPCPSTPIEQEAFRGVVAEEARQSSGPVGPLPLDSIDEVLLMMAWFRAHPDALRRTSKYEQWM